MNQLATNVRSSRLLAFSLSICLALSLPCLTGQKHGNGAVFLRPERVNPFPEPFPKGLIPVIIPDELRPDRDLFHLHDHFVHFPAKELPETFRSAGIDDRHVENGRELPPHRREDECGPSRPGPQEMGLRRLLPLVLFEGEPRALYEVHHRGGNGLKLLAGLHGGFQILALEKGISLQEFPGVPLHEREIQGPPGEPQDGEPDKLLLDEELEKGDLPVKHFLQDQDIYPALMIGKHQVPVALVQLLNPVDDPPDPMHQAPVQVVVPNPPDRDRVQDPGGERTPGPKWNEKLKNRHRIEERRPEERVHHDKGK